MIMIMYEFVLNGYLFSFQKFHILHAYGYKQNLNASQKHAHFQNNGTWNTYTLLLVLRYDKYNKYMASDWPL